MAMLEIENIHTYYGRIHALKDVSLNVDKGEIVTLIGANGAGKSTTLNTISGLLKPQPGIDPSRRGRPRPLPSPRDCDERCRSGSRRETHLRPADRHGKSGDGRLCLSTTVSRSPSQSGASLYPFSSIERTVRDRWQAPSAEGSNRCWPWDGP